jgi:hypothetical protein
MMKEKENCENLGEKTLASWYKKMIKFELSLNLSGCERGTETTLSAPRRVTGPGLLTSLMQYAYIYYKGNAAQLHVQRRAIR